MEHTEKILTTPSPKSTDTRNQFAHRHVENISVAFKKDEKKHTSASKKTKLLKLTLVMSVLSES